MNHRRTTPALSLLALSLAAAAAPARADILAEARISNFGYSLVDLRPRDGNAPGIAFSTLAPALGGGSEVNSEIGYLDRRIDPDGFGLGAQDRAQDGFRIFSPLSAGASLPGISTSGSMSGSLAQRSFSYGATGRFDLGGASGANWLGTGFRTDTAPVTAGPGGPGLDVFVLAPYTRVAWSGRASIRLQATDDLGPGAWHFTQGYVGFDLSSESGQRAQYGQYRSLNQQGPGKRVFEQAFRLGLSNNSATPLLVRMSAVSTASTQIYRPSSLAVSPVPEPGTWALLLCGLGLVGAAAARARRGHAGLAAPATVAA
ncbi:PEPxxWA-CTERM sorting domain-containing protein [Azohydromonas aeria]|uniref:PEPxxWA-CTERM sorting domain-containing protein n=1 Tax=Azohydromonas aeria TaxID=2590212 RepID=UPI0018DF5BEF|nr:PEPxxWA-CTERM sorting domain-containing protein [Azohydromonas aeria]